MRQFQSYVLVSERKKETHSHTHTINALQLRLILDYSDFHLFLYQNFLGLYGHNGLSKDNAYDNVLNGKRKMQNFIPLTQ